MTTEHGRSEDAEHRRIFPDRRCVVANAECSGNVAVSWGGAQLCTGHILRFDDADEAAKVERLRAWVREERKRGGTP